MKDLNRREFLMTAAVGATAMMSSVKVDARPLRGAPLLSGGRGISPISGKELKAVPSACWQCVSRDGIIGYVEDGRLVKIEGNPKLPRTNGKICSKGQAGMNQSYDPDRILYPMKHIGSKRGDGKWKRISWSEALDELTGKLRSLQKAGHPEKFMFHYGRMKASSSKIIKSYFLPAYGTKTIGNHTSICEGAKWTAQELTWGKHYDAVDINNTQFILNLGCNPLSAHTNHVPLAQRIAKAITDRKVDMVTLDVRLSHSAAKSREWVPIKPGTDLAVVLAMSHVLVSRGKVDRDFIETFTNTTVSELKKHLSSYTPAWAEKISGVPASKITSIALEYFDKSPSCILSYRGAVAHENGVECERAIQMLEAIAGNIDVKGGRCRAVGAKWKNSYKKPKVKAKKLKIMDGDGSIILPTHHVSEHVFKMIRDGSHGRPEIYMTYCYNPAYVNGNCQEVIDVLKDKKLIPYLVAVDVGFSETASLADLILPDTPYTERWDWEDMVSADGLHEYYIRQPMIRPLGESRDFKDVCCEIARRLGGNISEAMPFDSAKEFVQDACEHTKAIKDIGGFEYMVKHGAWVDPKEKPKYRRYAKEIPASKLAGAVLDQKTGVYWKGKPGQDYTNTKKSYKKYVGQKIGSKVYHGFPPDKVNKSGLFEIRSGFLEAEGRPGLPSWAPIPEHQTMREDQLILTTYKVPTQVHSRTQNCKYLTELYHRNPAWINPITAEKIGIEDEDEIKVTSAIGSLMTTAKVTHAIAPGVIAISNHCGHWAYGRYASGKKSPLGSGDDPDLELKWWDDNGAHPNWIIPNAAATVSGQLRFMDTVVSVEPA
jgi:thiosulfate reductase / polysulfide reductase chain A